MRKLVIIFLLLTTSLCKIQAQNRLGFVGGGVYAKSNLTNQNQKGQLSQTGITIGNVFSYFGGVIYDFKVTNQFSVKSRLLYINKGWTETKNIRRDRIDVSNNTTVPYEYINSKEYYKVSYLELPVNLTFYTPIGNSLLAFGVGPYISLGLSGKYTFKAISSNKYITSFANIPYDSAGMPRFQRVSVVKDTSNYLTDSTGVISFSGSKKANTLYNAYQFDYGASVEASVEFRIGLTISAGYTFGVTNVIKEHYGAIQNRHRTVMVSIGYYLKRKRKSS